MKLRWFCLNQGVSQNPPRFGLSSFNGHGLANSCEWQIVNTLRIKSFNIIKDITLFLHFSLKFFQLGGLKSDKMGYT